jgi:hypothetical protein
VHRVYLDIVKNLAAGRWGREFSDDPIKATEGELELLKNHSLEGMALLGIIQRIDRFIDALTVSTVKEKFSAANRELESQLVSHITDLEAKHGPCPVIVEKWYWRRLHEYVGQTVLRGDLPTRNEWNRVYDPYGSTTEVAREFRKWKRRKPRKPKPEAPSDGE